MTSAVPDMGTVRGSIPARVRSKTSPESFSFTARFVVERPDAGAIADHDERWHDLINRKVLVPRIATLVRSA